MNKMCLILLAVTLASKVLAQVSSSTDRNVEGSMSLIQLDSVLHLPAKSNIPTDEAKSLPWSFTRNPSEDAALVVRMKNLSKEKKVIVFVDNWVLRIEPEDGHQIFSVGGRDATRAPQESDFRTAMPGKCVNFLLEFKLAYDANQQLVLWGADDLGGIWAYTPIKPGRYKIWIEYSCMPPLGNTFFLESARQQFGLDLTNLWTGSCISNIIKMDVLP